MMRGFSENDGGLLLSTCQQQQPAGFVAKDEVVENAGQISICRCGLHKKIRSCHIVACVGILLLIWQEQDGLTWCQRPPRALLSS